MKKLFTFFTALVLSCVAVSAQTLVEYNFNDGNKEGLAIYDVDNYTPTSFMQSVGFVPGYTWILIKDSNTSTDMFLGSTSAYLPAGQANDWLVLPETLISGEGFKLEWKSQAFMANKRDGLKVFISTEGGNPGDFPTQPVWEVAEEEIGATEDYFENEFISHEISLDEYVGKRIYIAFVNQSYDKSLLCIDDIKVSRNAPFSIDVAVAGVVEEQDEITFSGTINNWRVDKIEQVDFILQYKGGEYTESLGGLNLAPGESAAFTLEHKAPIALNETLEYSIIASTYNAASSADASNIITQYTSSVTNTFHRYVVIEDHTGLWCSNCPSGYWALDSIKHVAPNNIAPITVQNNQGVNNPRLIVEEYDAGLSGAGLTAFPSGWVNRTYIQHPWGNGEYGFEDENSWVSLFEKEMAIVPQAGVVAQGTIGEDGKTLNAVAKVRTSENKDNLDWRVIYVVTEDSVKGFYQNNDLSGKNMWLGGWESRPRNASIVIDDLARGIYPSFYGEKGSLPAAMVAGEETTCTMDITLPLSTVNSKGETVEIIQNICNLNLIVMVVDGTTNRVVNANKVRIAVPEAVNDVKEGMGANIYTEAGSVRVVACDNAMLAATLYTVDGRVLAAAQGNQEILLHTAGYRGVAIVRVENGSDVVVRKVVLR